MSNTQLELRKVKTRLVTHPEIKEETRTLIENIINAQIDELEIKKGTANER